MSGLQEGCQYSLSTENNSNKSIIFVKLTDSAVQAIERLLNSKVESSPKPTIQLQNNSGVISLPLNGRKYDYEFTLSNIEGGGLQSSFQCLQHIDDGSLESLGFMLMKMQIHATEDSYEKTKCKMTAADQEQKNLCTKEVRQSSISWSGNKVSIKRPGMIYMPEKTHPSFIKPEPPKLCSKKKVTSPSILMQQPIRERIIHILAAKPYKKAEILLRLKRERISDKDKNQIDEILSEVAKLKGSIFILKNEIWEEVQDNWDFFSKEELELIRKKKQQLLNSKNVNGIINPFRTFVKQKDLPLERSPPEAAGMSFNKKQRLSLNGAQNYNKIFQNDSCITNGNALTNGSTIGTTEMLLHSRDVSSNLNGLSKLSKQITSMLSHKKDLSVDENNHFGNNGTLQLSKTQSTVNNNIPSLQTSFVLQEHGNEEMDVESDEKMSVDVAQHIVTVNNSSSCNVIDEHGCAASTSITSKAVSVCKSENGNVRQMQVKQSNSCSETNTIGSANSQSLSVLEKIRLFKKLLNEDSSLPSPKKGNKINDSRSKILPLTKPTPEFDFSEIKLKYTKVESLEQRSQYFQDFNEMYGEYMRLQTQMKENSEKFSALFDHLKTYAEGSLEFQKIKAEISKEYEAVLKNNSYIASRKKFEFLKAKLSHIKEVILEYDKSQSAE